jgi:hypothetical protein
MIAIAGGAVQRGLCALHGHAGPVDLTGADLRGAYLSSAVPTGADLRGAIGVADLGVADPRGYRLLAVAHDDGTAMLYAGCRRLTAAEALAHWGAPEYPDRVRGDRYVSAIRRWMGGES